MRSARRREGELVALAFNQKEQRLLEKSAATIRLEASYSLKLLDVGNRHMKLYFRQLRDRVAHLKSHLTADQIQQLRQLEAEGKLHPTHPSVNLGSALMIAATSRRLYSARQRSCPASPANRPSPLLSPYPAPTPAARLKRSNSVTGVFVDAPIATGSGSAHRPQSAGVTLDRHVPELTSLVSRKAGKDGKLPEGVADDTKLLELSGSCKAQEDRSGGRPDALETFRGHQEQSRKISTPVDKQKTTAEPEQQQRSVGFQCSPKPAGPRGVSRRASSSFVRAPFSSHAAIEKSQDAAVGTESRSSGDAVLTATTPRSRPSPVDRDSTFLGLLQDDTVDDLDQQLYEEKRAELLEREQLRAASLTKRKERFIKDLDQHLRDHPAPSVRPHHYSLTRKTSSTKKKKKGEGVDGDGEGEEEAGGTEVTLRRRRVELDLSPTYLPEQDYGERLRGLWKEMSQCRYLRVSDDCLDLSGVNTLATDTLKLYKVIRHRDRKTSHSAKTAPKETYW